jgi:hypothetical protein
MSLQRSASLAFDMQQSPTGWCGREPMPRRCMRAPSATLCSLICKWMNCARGCVATPRCVFLWVAIDPLTKCIPVLLLGPRTHRIAYLLIHHVREQLAAFLSADLHQRWPQCVLLRPHRSFWVWAQGSWEQEETVAGGGRLALWPSQETLSAAQVGASQTGDPPGNSPRLHRVLASFRLFWTSEHSLYRAGQSHAASWCGSLGTMHLGHCVADSPFTSPSTVVAGLLSRMSRPHASLRMALAQAREGDDRQVRPRYRQRTEALAAGRTNRRWTAREVLCYPLPPIPA